MAYLFFKKHFSNGRINGQTNGPIILCPKFYLVIKMIIYIVSEAFHCEFSTMYEHVTLMSICSAGGIKTIFLTCGAWNWFNIHWRRMVQEFLLASVGK